MRSAAQFPHARTTALTLLTLAWAGAWMAPAAPVDKLPDFISKVQLHNCGGVELAADGKGVMLYRLPKEVREKLDGKTPDGKERSGATQMRAAAHSEIRFVLNDGAKLSDVKLHLNSEKGASLVFFWGDVLAGEAKLMPRDKAKPITPPSHGLLDSLMEKFPKGRFANRVCRVVIKGTEVAFNGIDGDVRPPKPEELGPVMLSYGTSISQGAAASRADLAWNALTARAIGHDFINLGSSGTAFCEPAMAEYLAGLKWDVCVLELSVNMAGTGFSTAQFKERAGALIEKLASTHPKSPVVCISLFPYGTGDLWKKTTAAEYRKALEEVCKASGHKNVHFVSGPDFLSFNGLSEDLLHPSDHGMIEIATKLAPRIRTILEKKNLTSAAPVPLFNGKSFTGWEGDTEKTWRIEKGEIVAGKPDVKQPRNEFLCTTRDYADFELRLEYRRGDNNGGIQFRSERVPKHHEVSGYQADFAPGVDGCLYDESRRNRFLAVYGIPEVDLASDAGRPGALIKQAQALRAENEKKLKIDEWNRYRIRAEGPRIRLWINDVLTVDYTEKDSKIPLTGKIAVQIHSGATEIRYRNIVIEELNAKPAERP